MDIAANPPFEGVSEDEKVEDKPVKTIDIVDAFILQVSIVSPMIFFLRIQLLNEFGCYLCLMITKNTASLFVHL